MTREFQIRRILRKISKQRVALILKPGDVWVIEKALKIDEKVEAYIATCLMRGWIEILENSVPSGQLTKDVKLPNIPLNELFNETKNIYRITESGWSVINRQKTLLYLTFLVGLMTLILMILI
jgi:hypothetical protein